METPTRKDLTSADVQDEHWIEQRRNPAAILVPANMSTNQPTLPEFGAEQRSEAIRRDLRKLGRHNWSFWGLAVIVILALTVVVTTLSLQVISDPRDPFYQFHISQSVRALVGLVALFSVYTLYQQFLLKRTRQRLAEQVEISARRQVLAEEYLKLAMLDPLTGLHNRRYAQERLEAEISRAQRLQSSLTVLMIDLDDFKRLNDRHGHAAGDLALKTFGERLTSAIRGSDLAVRIGGDEFVVLLPECPLGEVQHVLNRLDALEIDVEKQKVSFRFSAGWTDFRKGETSEQLLQRADHALYVEKEARKAQPQPVG
ncbi:MAG TPA: GGDEF domain-containing protein [Candidatus Acidoferrales bacterium]|nr:GGDEF domain-containing protein [Candidatus Acidoferrales bacterium]